MIFGYSCPFYSLVRGNASSLIIQMTVVEDQFPPTPMNSCPQMLKCQVVNIMLFSSCCLFTSLVSRLERRSV